MAQGPSTRPGYGDAVTDAVRTRLTKADRRTQLLDVAAQLIVDSGASAITMEGLAEAAGVSKALPYAHFDNAVDVLAELYGREVDQLGGRILAAMEAVERGEQRLVVAIRTYFTVVEERGAVLAVVAGATRVGEEPDHELGPSFVGEILEENYGIAPARARRLGAMVLGVLDARHHAVGEGCGVTADGGVRGNRLHRRRCACRRAGVVSPRPIPPHAPVRRSSTISATRRSGGAGPAGQPGAAGSAR